MKKNLYFFAAIFILMLQSCSISTETVLHKNAETSSEYNIDFREVMLLTKGMMDSTKSDNKFADLEKLPKEWISLYDFEKKERKKSTTDEDSVRLMKKMFIKSNIEDGELVGISVRQDHFTKKDYEFLAKSDSKEKLPLNNKLFQSWNGKTLIIDTKNFNNNEFKPVGNTENGEVGENTMSQMMQMKFTSILKFESKIKSISGLHDWVKKVDDHTLKIAYDTDQIKNKDLKLKHQDPQIVVVTE